ncbi:MAG: GNAT family N-acetyltransferase [Phycisphaerae bacterium]|nr:GNAT family N-acetyltransferase [Phycisphaerae bacterium]
MRVEPLILELPDGRARLEPLTPEHAASLFKVYGEDPDFFRYYTIAAPDTPAKMSAWVGAALDQQASGLALPFAVFDKSIGEFCGSTRYMDIQPANRMLEIGSTFYRPRSRRTSVNTECKYLLLRHAFEVLGCVRVQLKCDARNEPSRAAILRIGASFEGIIRQHLARHDGTFRDSAMFSIIESEWPGVKERLERMLSRSG